MKSAANGLIVSVKGGSLDDSAYPLIHYWSRADFPDGVISTMTQLVEIDCEGSRYRYVSGTATDDDGTTVETPPTQWAASAPGNVRGDFHALACEDGKKNHR